MSAVVLAGCKQECMAMFFLFFFILFIPHASLKLMA